jgi:hypothetical protein
MRQATHRVGRRADNGLRDLCQFGPSSPVCSFVEKPSLVFARCASNSIR